MGCTLCVGLCLITTCLLLLGADVFLTVRVVHEAKYGIKSGTCKCQSATSEPFTFCSASHGCTTLHRCNLRVVVLQHNADASFHTDLSIWKDEFTSEGRCPISADLASVGVEYHDSAHPQAWAIPLANQQPNPTQSVAIPSNYSPPSGRLPPGTPTPTPTPTPAVFPPDMVCTGCDAQASGFECFFRNDHRDEAFVIRRDVLSRGVGTLVTCIALWVISLIVTAPTVCVLKSIRFWNELDTCLGGKGHCLDLFRPWREKRMHQDSFTSVNGHRMHPMAFQSSRVQPQALTLRDSSVLMSQSSPTSQVIPTILPPDFSILPIPVSSPQSMMSPAYPNPLADPHHRGRTTNNNALPYPISAAPRLQGMSFQTSTSESMASASFNISWEGDTPNSSRMNSVHAWTMGHQRGGTTTVPDSEGPDNQLQHAQQPQQSQPLQNVELIQPFQHVQHGHH